VPAAEELLVKNLATFVAFTRKRVGDEALAADLVQDSLIKALSAERKPAKDEDSVAWFYRILRHSIIDLYRRNEARKRALARFESELPATPGGAEERMLCQCFRRLLPSLPAQYRDLLEQIDLGGKAPAQVAAKLGVTRNNLTVRLHRARKQLRELLSQNCRACSRHGCLDCTCDD